MGDSEKGDEGTSAETGSLEDILDVFEDVRGPVITSSDVADQFDWSTDTARQKLQQLYDRGKVDKRKTGRVIVWWHTREIAPTPSDQAPESGEIQGGIETSLDDNLPGEHIGEDEQ